MQDGDSYCFQLIEAGVSFPPILVKAEVQFSTPHGTPSSSQTASLRLQAIRFLNGKQEIVQLDLGGANDSDAFVKAVSGKKGLNKHMSMKECCQEVYDRFQAGKFTKDYGHTDSKLKVRSLLGISEEMLHYAHAMHNALARLHGYESSYCRF